MPDLDDLISELTARTDRQHTGRHALLAETLPLLHRCGRALELIDGLDATSQLLPGVGSSARTSLGLDNNTFEWVGTCAYPGHLILVWEARRDDLGGSGAPWDTAGLMTKATVGRNVSETEARLLLERYSVSCDSYRNFLSTVLECSFSEPENYLRGHAPARWYPGWEGDPIRAPNPPSHTFEVRRLAQSPVLDDLVAVIVDAAEFAEHPAPLRKLRQFLRKNGVRYEATHPGERAERAAQRFVMEYLTELRCL